MVHLPPTEEKFGFKNIKRAKIPLDTNKALRFMNAKIVQVALEAKRYPPGSMEPDLRRKMKEKAKIALEVRKTR
ncbi:hypothetical protein [Alkalihalobacillus sp. TS-13]|uniref:hypothetical protein n=1 Tax=Alkalihalobacillus sp. TS-13 TaxID=2842455 RepID=UPI001C868DAF|nr:hypothetical protein [Alkalihalobacillus sp. TS-13]